MVCQRVFSADASCTPEAQASSSIGARLVVVVTGERELRCSRNGSVVTQRLIAGDALLAAPGSWLLSVGRWRYELLTFVVQPDYMRAFHRPLRRYDSPAPAAPAAWYHTARPPPTLLVDQLRMVGEILQRNADSAAAVHLVRASLASACEELERDRSELMPRADQARRSWNAVLSFLEENVHRDIGRGEVARATGLSPGHVTRLFARFGAGGFQRHMSELRLERARHLLRGSELSVGEVAAACGMIPHRLIRLFKASTGTTPGRYRDGEAQTRIHPDPA